MRIIFTYLIITSIVVMSSSRLVILAEWSMHRDEITEMFCVNKAKPELLCSGRCYLNDQLLDYEQDMSSTTSSSLELLYHPWSIHPDILPLLVGQTSLDKDETNWAQITDTGRAYCTFLLAPPDGRSVLS